MSVPHDPISCRRFLAATGAGLASLQLDGRADAGGHGDTPSQPRSALVTTRFVHDDREWLEPDGLGGFASGTVSGVRTRRYHGLLLVATRPPTGRVMLLNGFDAWLATRDGRVALSSQRYAPDVVYPDGRTRIESFTTDPWPTWVFRVENGLRVQQEIFVPLERPAAVVTWRLVDRGGQNNSADEGPRLVVRPFLSGRDYHATHHENAACRTDAHVRDRLVAWCPYGDLPATVSRANARYEHTPDWYRRFRYTVEGERGLDDTEDLFAPGWLSWDVSSSDAVWLIEAQAQEIEAVGDVVDMVDQLRESERQRRATFTPLHRSAAAYLVRRGGGKTIIAGYPWFTDWGRDTFIALRGLCLSTGRIDDARDILLEWSGAVCEGMLPNRFPDAALEPEFNAVDASLWFIAAVQDFCQAADHGRADLSADQHAVMMEAVERILDGYSRGARFGIRMDTDGLLACGVAGVALTWMDARVGGRPVTPRIGKPVEVQALWLNAVRFAGVREPRWRDVYRRGRAAFAQRFWFDEGGYLYDVVDVDHQPGRVDARFRPNQIFAIGGLSEMLIDLHRARRIVDLVEQRLVTPMGLRSLAPAEPGFAPHYAGGPAERDRAYHQGTVWPWLMGAFVDAWLAVRDDADDARREAWDRFVRPLHACLDEAGLGHLSEIADAMPPFTPRGCPFQAWSLGELLRIESRLTNGANCPQGPAQEKTRSGRSVRL